MQGSGQAAKLELRLIDRLYAAALGEIGWRETLLAVREHLMVDELSGGNSDADDAPHLFDIKSSSDLVRLRAALNRHPRVASRLEPLTPHLIRALELRQRFFTEAALGQAAVATLDALPQGVVFLDAAAIVIFRNWVAQRITHQRQGIELSGERVRATADESDCLLQRLIANAIAQLGYRRPLGMGALCVGDGQSTERLVVSVWSLPCDQRDEEFDGPRVALFVANPSQTMDGIEDLCRETFGLSPREGYLVGHLLAGRELAEAAEQMGIARKTARVHLERIFAKTNTHRQVDLVRLLSASLTPATGFLENYVGHFRPQTDECVNRTDSGSISRLTEFVNSGA